MSPDAERAPPPWIETLVADAQAAQARGAQPLAVAILQRAAAVSPTLQIQRALGLGLLRAGRLGDAAKPLRAAMMQAPLDAEVRYGLGLCLIAAGRGREGAALAEARFEIPRLAARKPAGFPHPEWRGEGLAGRHLVLFPDLGLDDQLLAARFVPVVQAAGARVTLLTPPALLRLFTDSFDGATVMSAAGAVEFDEPDCWAMLTSLVGLASPSEPPPAPPFLRSTARRRGRGLQICLSVAGLPEALTERLRAGLPGKLVEAPAGADLAETAALMAGSDLVVCDAGAAAQLAGGLGLSTLALVPAQDAHWSFAMGSQAAVWRPTVEAFRADPGGGWNGAVERVLDAAQARVKG